MELYILALLTIALTVLSVVLGRMLLIEKYERQLEADRLRGHHAVEIKGLFKDFESAKINMLASFQTEREKYIDALYRKEVGGTVFGERDKPKPPMPAETALDRKQRLKRERDEPQLGETADAAILEGI
jgi:hypothetical protein